AKALKAQGVRTVFRYYCQLPPSIPGKDLQPEEAKIILSEGLSLGVVFQHYNNCFRTFENRWGTEDAQQALKMAEAIGQPKGSAIYFGVDGDWPWASLSDAIVAYFEDVNRVFDGTGFDVGIYSNGCTCNLIRTRKLAKYFWLSGSTGHSGTQAFYNTGNWTLCQNALDITLASANLGVDTNLCNPAAGYFGQFDARGAKSAAHPAAAAQSLIARRRFLNANTDLKATPDSGAPTLIAIRKDQNVRLVQQSGPWAKVLTQEGGKSRAGAAQEGWLPLSALMPMSAFPDSSPTYGLCGASSVPGDTVKYQNCERATSRLR
ncbi:MAG: DUF1906 domain-containing protein, partial [Caulobacterales bacterium]